MKVELSIKDDSELRALIKDMIRGQIKSVTREDISDLLLFAIKKGSNLKNKEAIKNVEKAFTKELQTLVTDFKGNLEFRIRQSLRAIILEKMDIEKAIKEEIVKEVKGCLKEITRE